MAEPDATQVIAGPGLIMIAPLGTALPTLAAPVVWPAGWTAVGYTDAGIDIAYTPTVKEVMVDELTAPVLDILEKEKFHMAAHLAEVTLANLNAAIAASTLDANGVHAGSLPLNYIMVGAEGPAPPSGSTNRRLIIIQKALTVVAVSMKMTRKDKVVFPVSWEARQLTGQDLFTISDLVGA